MNTSQYTVFSIIIISLISTNMHGMQIKKFQKLLILDKCHQKTLCTTTKIKTDVEKLEIEKPCYTYGIMTSFISEEQEKIENEEYKYPKTIPYGGPSTNDPKKKLKKGYEGQWLAMIEQRMKNRE